MGVCWSYMEFVSVISVRTKSEMMRTSVRIQIMLLFELGSMDVHGGFIYYKGRA